MKILLATQNPGKLKYLRTAFESCVDLQLEILPDEYCAPEESAETILGNALIKAHGAWEQFGGWVLADDSGLFIEALDGAPGVKSARFAGEGAEDSALRQKVLALMSGKANRNAAFRCALVLITPEGKEAHFFGESKGSIAEEEMGTARKGLAYTPLFIPEAYQKSLAQLPYEEAVKLSHRTLATRKLQEYLRTCDTL